MSLSKAAAMTVELHGRHFEVTEEGLQLACSLLPVGARPDDRQVLSLLMAWSARRLGIRDQAWLDAQVEQIAADCYFEGA